MDYEVIRIFGLKTCDTCRKAKKAVEDSVLVDVREDGLPDAILTRALAEFGAALVNTWSTTWRNLDEADRPLPAETLLRRHPALMKRPLIVAGGRLYLGWGRDVQAALGV